MSPLSFHIGRLISPFHYMLLSERNEILRAQPWSEIDNRGRATVRHKVKSSNGLRIVSEAQAASQMSGRRACVTKEGLDVLPSVLPFFSSALVYNQCSGLISEALKARHISAQGNALVWRKPNKYSPVGATQESTYSAPTGLQEMLSHKPWALPWVRDPHTHKPRRGGRNHVLARSLCGPYGAYIGGQDPRAYALGYILCAPTGLIAPGAAVEGPDCRRWVLDVPKLGQYPVWRTLRLRPPSRNHTLRRPSHRTSRHRPPLDALRPTPVTGKLRGSGFGLRWPWLRAG